MTFNYVLLCKLYKNRSVINCTLAVFLIFFIKTANLSWPFLDHINLFMKRALMSTLIAKMLESSFFLFY